MYRNTTILFVSLLVGLTGPSSAATFPAVLADSGVVYEVRTGTYGSLFSDDAVDPGMRVLALVATTADSASSHLVPLTDDAALDHQPTLVYDPTGNAINIVWERRDPSVTEIKLVRFDATGWSEVTTLLTRSTGTAIRAARTLAQDGFSWSAASGTPTRSDRAILHLAWRDEAEQDVRYSPLVFLDGQFSGWSESLSLLGLFGVDGTLPTGDPTPALLDALTIAPSADGQTIQTAFTDPRSGHTVVLQIDTQPLDLAFFAAEIRVGLEALSGLYQAGSASSIRGPMRATIVIGGQGLGLDESIVTYVADTVESWADAWTAINPDADFAAFSAALLDLVNDLTLALFTGADGGQVIELDLGTDVTVPTQLFQVHVASTHPAPATNNGLHRVFTSSDGSRVLIAWYEAATSSVHYLESTGDPAEPWNERSTILLTETMTPERVEGLLRQRVQ